HEFSNLAQAFYKLGKRYNTKIIGLYLGPVPTIVLNDPADIKEMLNREERFSLRILRDYGFGRRSDTLESVIASEIKEMIDMRISGTKFPAEKQVVDGELVYMPHYFAAPFMNGMCHVLSRMTLPREEYRVLWEVAQGALLFQRSSNDMGGALSLTPWLKDVMPGYSGYSSLVKGNQYLLDFFRRFLATASAMNTPRPGPSRSSRTPENIKLVERSARLSIRKRAASLRLPRAIVHEILKKDRTFHPFKIQILVLTCTDYMFPTASAVESVLTMLVERMLLQPEIQDKMHEEIDRVGTMLSPNFVMLHMDKGIWGDPDNFRPERFIVDGTLHVAKDKSLPFGAGRRLCAGETYARQSMFQVLAGFMQAFRVSTADGRPLLEPAERIQGIITTIPNFWHNEIDLCAVR
ncbi:Uncharacterized protein OBRU01_06974, partial [Operophtera brumata]